jgi:hypothetical protein
MVLSGNFNIVNAVRQGIGIKSGVPSKFVFRTLLHTTTYHSFSNHGNPPLGHAETNKVPWEDPTQKL